VVVAAAATLFLGVFRLIRTAFTKLPGPVWIRPGIGGLALGLLSVPIILLVGNFVHIPGQGIGLLGGGYGAVQMAISGVSWLPDGWHAVLLLSVIAFAKMVATSFTIGSGGSAGDFAPSLAIGGLVGGAFGQTARILFADPAIDPGAFALVGMGAFYGGLAHVPLAAVILVCELAGSYDLLVPLMLAQGIAFVVLRNRSLYEAQESDHIHSPVRRPDRTTDLLKTIPVEEAALKNRSFARFQPSDPIEHITAECRAHPDQEIFPVVKGDGTIRGIISWSSVATASSNRDFLPWIIASDVMQPPVAVFEGNDLRAAVELLAANGIRQIPVVNSEARLTALLTQEDIVTAWARVSTHPVQPETRP